METCYSLAIVVRQYGYWVLCGLLAACGRVGFSSDTEPTDMQAFRYGDHFGDRAGAMAVDNRGRVYVAGYVAGVADFGTTSITAADGTALFVPQLETDGTAAWLFSADGAGLDQASAIAVGSDGRVCAAGFFTQGMVLQDATLTSGGDSDGVVFCVDAQGELLWHRVMTGPSRIEATSLAVAADQSVYVAGYFKNTLRTAGLSLTSVGDSDAFALHLAADGTPDWLRAVGGPGPDRGTSIEVDDADVYLLSEGMQIADGSSEITFETPLRPTLAVTRFDTAGDLQWSTRAIGDHRLFAGGIKVEAGVVYVAAAFAGDLAFADTTSTTEDLFLDAALLTFSRSGEARSLSVLPGPVAGSMRTYGLDAAAGGLYWTGYFSDVMADGLESNGARDLFVLRSSFEGETEWTRAVGGLGNDEGLALSVGPDRAVWVAGRVSGAVTGVPASVDTQVADALVLRFGTD